MANVKITDLTAYTDPLNTDVLAIVDVTNNVTKKVSIANMAKNVSLGTAALPGVAFDGDPDTGIYSPGANQVGISTSGTVRLTTTTSGITSALPIDVPLGAVGTPSLTFTGDLNTGIYSPGADQLAISTGGTSRLAVSTTAVSSTLAVDVPLGAAATPSITFTGDLNTGIYSPGADQLAISTNGVERLRIDSNGDLLSGTTGNLGYGGRNIILKSGQGYAGIASLATESRIFNTWDTTAIPMTFFQGGTERMRLDSSGRLGIGTSSPVGLFELKGSSTSYSSSAAVIFTDANSASTNNRWLVGNVNVNAPGDFIVSSAPTPSSTTYNLRLLINAAGNVGIGTTSPVSTLTVNGIGAFGANSGSADVSAARELYIRGASNSSLISFQTSTTGSNGFLVGAIASEGRVQMVDAFPITFHTSNAERARIDSSGRLLVGTSTQLPVYYNAADTWNGVFQVARSTQDAVASFSIWNSQATTYTTYGGVQLHLSACRSGSVGTHTSGALSSGDTIGSITFDASDGTNFRNSARIEAVVDGGVSTGDVPGRLVFSTTADGAASPTERMRITSGSDLVGISAAANTHALLSYHQSGAGTTWAHFIGKYGSTAPYTGGTNSIIIWNNGDVQNANNSYGSLSDVKLKENIVNATSQWSDIKTLQVRKYNLKEGQTHTQIGLVAQEVELVSPGLVYETPDRDEEGNDLGTVTKGVNYSVLYMKAVKALQEAMERIESLETRLSALEGA